MSRSAGGGGVTSFFGSDATSPNGVGVTSIVGDDDSENVHLL